MAKKKKTKKKKTTSIKGDPWSERVIQELKTVSEPADYYWVSFDDKGSAIIEIPAPASTEALRFDDDKLRFDLIPTEVVIELARAYSMGAIKYGDNNFRKGMAWSRCVRSAFSHFYKWLSGKGVDEETGCHHLALAAWNLLTLLYYEINKVGTDNRNKFNIDDNFNWTDNHLGIGLNKDRLAALKEQYKNKRSPQ
jgi:hypothetical protein